MAFYSHGVSLCDRAVSGGPCVRLVTNFFSFFLLSRVTIDVQSKKHCFVIDVYALLVLLFVIEFSLPFIVTGIVLHLWRGLCEPDVRLNVAEYFTPVTDRK